MLCLCASLCLRLPCFRVPPPPLPPHPLPLCLPVVPCADSRRLPAPAPSSYPASYPVQFFPCAGSLILPCASLRRLKVASRSGGGEKAPTSTAPRGLLRRLLLLQVLLRALLLLRGPAAARGLLRALLLLHLLLQVLLP